MRIPKISLSPELEKRFFEERLSKKEILRLRSICEAYQSFSAPAWTELSYRPYSQYFGFINALKARLATTELLENGYLKVLGKNFEILDFGAGSLGASLGALDALREKHVEVSHLRAVDSHPEILNWAKTYFQDFLPSNFSIDTRWPSSSAPQIILMANVWNEVFLKSGEIDFEMPAWTSLEKRIESASETQIFVFIEPASRAINTSFLRMRDRLSGKTNILLPCTHQESCPALQQNEWCHEDRAFKANGMFWERVRDLGFRQKTLSFSFLAVGKQKSAFRPTQARVVSHDVAGKGRCDKWLCSQGKRWKESRLLRHKNEETASFYEALRGDIIDCASTLDSRPD